MPFEVAVVLQLSEDVNPKKALAGFEPMQAPADRNSPYYTNHDFLVRVVGKRTVLVGTMGLPASLAAVKVAGKHPLAESLQEAASGKKTIFAVGNLGVLPPQAFRDVPPPIRPLFDAQTAKVAITLGKTAVVEATLVYRDKDAAGDAEKSVDSLKEMGRQVLAKLQAEAKNKLANAPAASLFDFEKSVETIGPVFAIGSAKQMQDMLDKLPISREGESLTAKIPIPEEFQSVAFVSVPVAIALLVPAVQKVREAAGRTQDMNNLKQIGLAMHNYHDTYKTFPPPANGKDGKPLLSWRVALLPYIEESALYRKFKLDEPWDSEHNKELIPLMPKLYAIPSVKTEEGMTHYQVMVGGKGANPALYGDMFDRPKFTGILDGSSNTVMIAQGEKAVPWTKPDDIVFDPKGAPPKLYRHAYGHIVGFCDGSVRILSPQLRPDTLKALITRSGNEVADPDE